MSGDKTVNVNDEKEFKNNSSDKCVGNENITKEEYNQYVENITPSFPLWKNMLKAFITGGLICLMGQVWNGQRTGSQLDNGCIDSGKCNINRSQYLS